MNKNTSTLEEKELISITKIIDDISEKYDKLWVQRNRSINSKFLVSFIFQIISHKNKGYGISLLDLWDKYNEQNIKLPQKEIFAPSSVCEARQKLSEDIFIDLNNSLISQYDNKKEKAMLLNKHRVFTIDGSRVNLPKELKLQNYKTCNKESHYPQGLMSCIYNLDTHIVYDFCLAKKLSERDCAIDHLDVLQSGDVVIFDRGYFSYIFLYQCLKKGIHPIFRVSINLQNKQIQKFMQSDKIDSVVEFIPSTTIKYQIKREYNLECRPISLRLIKHTIDDNVYLYATTLISQEYKTSLFATLYNNRWNIEELYKISKCLVNIERFHSKSERGIKQEIYAHFVLINLARFFQFAANIKHNNDASNIKYNFKNSLNIISKNIQRLIFKSKIFLTKAITKITRSIAKIKQRIRPLRSYQRISHKPLNKWVITRSPHWT